MSKADLYLFDKLFALNAQTSIVPYNVDQNNSSPYIIAFDYLALIALSADNFAPLMRGDGSFTSQDNARSTIVHVIASAYTIEEDVLISLVCPRLGDYAVAGVIGNISTDASVVLDIDEILFNGTYAIIRNIKNLNLVVSGPNDYATMSAIVKIMLSYGLTLNYILQSTMTNNKLVVQALGGDVNVAIAAYALIELYVQYKFRSFLEWLNVTSSTVNLSGTDIYSGVEIYSDEDLNSGDGVEADVPGNNANVIKALVNVADNIDPSLSISMGEFLFDMALSGMYHAITIVTDVVNAIIATKCQTVNGQFNVTPSATCNSIIAHFFGNIAHASLDSITAENIVVKKLVTFYNNVSNNVINLAYVKATPLGLWIQFVNVSYLFYTDTSKKQSNYSVDDILNVTQTWIVYDFSSGKSTNIESRQLITGEDLVFAGIITVDELPSYISYTTVSNNSVVTSQVANLQLIFNVAKTMDQASASTLYSQMLASYVGQTVYDQMSAGKFAAEDIQAALSDSMTLAQVQAAINNALSKYDGSGIPSHYPRPNGINPYI